MRVVGTSSDRAGDKKAVGNRVPPNPHAIRALLVASRESMLANPSDQAFAARGIRWLGRVSTMAEAGERLEQSPVDVVVTETVLPDADGAEVCRWLHDRWPAVHTVMATTLMNDSVISDTITAGATGFVVNPISAGQLADALWTVAEGGIWGDPRLREGLIQRWRDAQALQIRLASAESYRDRLKALQAGMTAIASIQDVEEMLRRVVHLHRELMEARYAALAVLNPDESIAQFITSGMGPENVRLIGPLPRGRGLLGEVIRARRPIRVDAINRHPASSGFPPNHPPMQSFLGVPMLFQGDVVGHLYVTDTVHGAFTEADEELAVLLAGQAAVLITNAKLRRDLKRLVLVEERQRMSMDLHDGTLQTIYAVLLGIDTVLAKLPPENDQRAALDTLAERLSQATQEIREMILDLKQEDPGDLLQVIEGIADHLSIRSILRINTADPRYADLPRETVEQLGQWVREALSNVVRHAHADQVEVTWRQLENEFRLTVEDDGVGFDLNDVERTGHFGLHHLHQRGEQLGGKVTIASVPRRGTRVELVVPLISSIH